MKEAELFISDWRWAWWGDNYTRLAQIKKKYTPGTLLKYWKCVGFKGGDVLRLLGEIIARRRFRARGFRIIFIGCPLLSFNIKV